MVRYIFGSYEPYREAPGRAPADHADLDRSYAPFDFVDAPYEDGYDDAYDEFYGYLPVEGHNPGGEVDDVPFGDLYEIYGEDERGVGADASVPRVSAEVPAGSLDTDRSRPRPAAGRVPGPGPVRRFPSPVSNVGVGRGGAGPRRRSSDRSAGQVALRRRRRIFLALVATVALTLAGVPVFQSPGAWIVHGMAVTLLAGYIVLLVVHHQRIQEKATKVRELGTDDGRDRSTLDIGFGAEVAR